MWVAVLRSPRCCVVTFPSRANLIRFSLKPEGEEHPRGRHVNETPSDVASISDSLVSATEKERSWSRLPIMCIGSQQRLSGFHNSPGCDKRPVLCAGCSIEQSLVSSSVIWLGSVAFRLKTGDGIIFHNRVPCFIHIELIFEVRLRV
jgi:hypothetical protein